MQGNAEHQTRLSVRHHTLGSLETLSRLLRGRANRYAWFGLGLGLFALSPLPSAQLFMAAGLARMRLLPFTAAFFAGRFVSYTIYGVTAHTIRATSLGEIVRSSLTSPWGIALQVAMLAGIVALTRIDWRKRLGGGDTPER